MVPKNPDGQIEISPSEDKLKNPDRSKLKIPLLRHMMRKNHVRLNMKVSLLRYDV